MNQLKKDYHIFLPEKNTLTKEMLLAGHYPPLLVNQEHLLWGAAILESALEQQVSGLWAREAESSTPRDIMAEVLMCENRSGRYSWQEIDSVYTLAHNPEDEVFGAQVFGKNTQTQLKNLAFYRAVPPRIAALINQKAIDFKLAENLMTLDEESRNFLLENPAFIGFSFSQKRIFFHHFHEACERDQITGQAALVKLEEFFIALDPLAALYVWRYPQLSEMEGRFQAFLETYLKKSGVVLKAPPCFEGKNFSVEFAFSTPKNLNKRIQALKDLEAHAHELFELL